MHATLLQLLLFSFLLIAPGLAQAQFLDGFEEDEIEGWFFFTGDGDATMDFVQKDGFARILVDATNDRHNVWWAVIKRDVAPSLDLSELQAPDAELRVEARVRVSHAPRRLNVMINTQRTTDFHKQLTEYDIPDTTGWHTISMTTDDLDAVPGDSLYVQLGVTDWGFGTYHVDVDYYRAAVVNVREAGPDEGEPLPYHPPVPNVDTFSHHLDVTHDAVIHVDFPDVNYNDWHVDEMEGEVPVIAVGTRQWAVLRWDVGPYAEAEADGAGLLELTTHSVSKGGDYISAYGEDLGIEFGKVRVIEILGGDPAWDQDEVTYNRLTQGRPYADVFNGQMVFDVAPAAKQGDETYITLSRPVLQRLLDGTTKGLLLKPLGALQASFYASEQAGDLGPKLHLHLKQ